METIKEILHKADQKKPKTGSPDLRPPKRSSHDSKGPVSSRDFENLPDTPKPETCQFCGATLYRSGFLMGDHIFWNAFADRCTCPEAVAAYEAEQAAQKEREQAQKQDEENRKFGERVKRITGESGMGTRFLQRTFDTFQETEGNRLALKACRRYANSFDRLLPKDGQPAPGKNGLFISGAPGTGKTHLAAAISNQLLSQGRAVICMTMIDLLGRIKHTFGKDGVDEWEVLQTYKEVPLLVIDDMGKEPPSDWAISTIYSIVNARYEACLPTIVTTNYTTGDLITRMTPRATGDDTTAIATVDRLLEMCAGLSITGKSWRGREKWQNVEKSGI